MVVLLKRRKSAGSLHGKRLFFPITLFLPIATIRETRIIQFRIADFGLRI
jgi:hypothetical protein